MPSAVQHTIRMKWDTRSNGRKHNPRLSNADVYIGGLLLRYSFVDTKNGKKFPYEMYVELIDDAVKAFDHHWNISVRCRAFGRTWKDTFSESNRRLCFYRFKAGAQSIADYWSIVEYDAYHFRKNFADEQQAKKCGNEYRIEIEKDNGVVWVNRELLVAESEYFREQLALPENSTSMKIENVSTAEFLEYVYCLHPPTLKLTFSRVPRIMKLAKQFQNKNLESSCKTFLKAFRPKDSCERLKYLIETDREGFSDAFEQTFKKLKQSDLKHLDIQAVVNFTPSNLRHFLEFLNKTSKSRNSRFLSGVYTAFIFPVATVKFLSNLLPAKELKKPKNCCDFLLDISTAISRHYDCTILIDDCDAKPIYVKKSILAMHSEYFKALFFGGEAKGGGGVRRCLTGALPPPFCLPQGMEPLQA